MNDEMLVAGSAAQRTLSTAEQAQSHTGVGLSGWTSMQELGSATETEISPYKSTVGVLGLSLLERLGLLFFNYVTLLYFSIATMM